MHVVVLTYGPGQLTKNAVRRARRLTGSGEQIIAVAASPVGVDIVGSLPGADSVPGFGGTALRAALAELPAEPTLLIHDDIVITTRGLVALERSLAEGNRYAVPYSNDPNTDNFIGSLPADRAAEKMLDRLPVPEESREAARIRPTCIAAKAPDLLELLAEPVVDPYASMNSSDYGIWVAGGAVAAHSTQCLHQLVAEPAVEAPLIVGALIVRDEEQMLPECLASLQEVCDRIEVCDTGSTDRTIAIAAESGANVIEREWTDDFGAARNHVLDQCRDATYVLTVDADERLVCGNPVHTRRYLATYAAEHPAFSLQVTNLDSDGKEQNTLPQVRLFHSDAEYRGALHEVLYLPGDERPLSGHRFGQMKLNHHGYSNEIIERRNKKERNLQIAEAQHAAHGDAHSAIHLARSLGLSGDEPERAIALLEEGLSSATSAESVSQLKGLIAHNHLRLGDARAAFDLAHEALQALPGDDAALGILGMASAELGNSQELIEVGEQFRQGTRVVVSAINNRRVFQDHLVTAYARVGNAEKAVSEAFEFLDSGTTTLTGWPELIVCLNDHFGGASLELLVPLALKDDGGGFLEPLIKSYPSGIVADFCATYLSQGGHLHEAIRIGLLAAALSSNDRAFAQLAPAAANLDPAALFKLANRIDASGRPDLAANLREQRAAS